MVEQRESTESRIESNNASHVLQQYLYELKVDFYPISHDHKDTGEHMEEVVKVLQEPSCQGWSMYHFPAWHNFENGSFDGMITILTSKKVEYAQAEKLANLVYNLGADHPDDIKAKLDGIAEKAQFAFWEVVASELYEAKTGDFGPPETFTFDEACEEAVRIWYGYNCITEMLGE